MWSYIIRRVLQMIPTLFGVMLLLFILFNWVGGDPSYILAGKSLSDETLASIRAQLGLDQSLPAQFLIFVRQVLTLDFGTSWVTQQPVSQTIASHIVPSLTLMTAWLITSTVIAISMAGLVAYFRASLLDRTVTVISTVAMSVSVLVYIILGQYFLAYKFQLFPVLGWSDNLWRNLTVFVPLPLILGLAVSLAPDVRFYRSCFLEEMNHDYVRTARAKGLSERAVMVRHVMRNAMIPIVTQLMMYLPFMIVGALLLERFFGIPGMGREVLLSVERSDFPMIKAITIYIVMAIMVFNLLADLVYRWLDPRVQLQ
jgi:peptide/nickel transport system permease protein